MLYNYLLLSASPLKKTNFGKLDKIKNSGYSLRL